MTKKAYEWFLLQEISIETTSTTAIIQSFNRLNLNIVHAGKLLTYSSNLSSIQVGQDNLERVHVPIWAVSRGQVHAKTDRTVWTHHWDVGLPPSLCMLPQPGILHTSVTHITHYHSQQKHYAPFMTVGTYSIRTIDSERMMCCWATTLNTHSLTTHGIGLYISVCLCSVFVT